MRIVYSLVLILATSVAFAAGNASTTNPTQGVFTSVNGKVEVASQKGKKFHTAQKDSTVIEGTLVKTGKDSNATLRLFDGSELKISPNTEFQLSKLQKPSLQDKVIKFKLLLGKLLANVKKLATSKSSFEIEAGGIVCGVRGTQFSIDYNPDANKVDLNVFEGSVYTNVGGHTTIFNAGQQMEFLNGVMNNNPPQSNNNQNPGANGGPDNGQTDDTALDDLQDQVGLGLLTNGDNNYTDPSVEGSVKINIRANVPATEAVP